MMQKIDLEELIFLYLSMFIDFFYLKFNLKVYDQILFVYIVIYEFIVYLIIDIRLVIYFLIFI